MSSAPPAPAQPTPLQVLKALEGLAAHAANQIAALEAKAAHPLFFLFAFFFSAAKHRRLRELRYIQEALAALADIACPLLALPASPTHTPPRRIRIRRAQSAALRASAARTLPAPRQLLPQAPAERPRTRASPRLCVRGAQIHRPALAGRQSPLGYRQAALLRAAAQ